MIELNFPTDWARSKLSPHKLASGQFRASPEDFRVDEILGFSPSGEGEHIYIQIEKIGQNTQWIQDELSRQLGIDRKLVGRSGLKDRHAVTRQWLSVQAPKLSLDASRIQIDGVRVIRVARHEKKLRPGMHVANDFHLVLKNVEADTASLDNALTNLSNRGFPNYFGDQRFGHEGSNLTKGWQLLAQRKLNTHKNKGIYLSALRAFLCNRVMSCRLTDDPRVSCQQNDQQTGNSSQLDTPDASDTPYTPDIIDVFDTFDAAAPLWGRGRMQVTEAQEAYEKRVLRGWQPLCEALEFSGLNQERRPLFAVPENLRWQWQGASTLSLNFRLPAGSYATSLLREIGYFVDVAPR